jgi:hypothetical protein
MAGILDPSYGGAPPLKRINFLLRAWKYPFGRVAAMQKNAKLR